MRQRCAAYEKNQEKFSVITEFSNLDNKEIRKRAVGLRNVYSSDLESSLDNEFGHFHAYCTEKIMEQNSLFDLLKLSHANELYTAFPNVKIANRIFMSYDISCNKLAQHYRFHVWRELKTSYVLQWPPIDSIVWLLYASNPTYFNI